jgi:hypothetical protein
MLRVLLIVLPIVLAIYALVDLVQTDDDEVQGLPKLAWVALIVLIWVVGPIAWLVAGKRGRRRWLPGTAPRAAGPSGAAPGRPLAPDDDPDFLRGLGRPKPPPPPRDDDGDDPSPSSR